MTVSLSCQGRWRADRPRDHTGLPLAWRVETARRNESLYVAPLLDALRVRGVVPIVCLRKGRPIPLSAIPVRLRRVETPLPWPRRRARLRQAQERVRPDASAHTGH